MAHEPAPFWMFAKRMLRYRLTAAGALAMAFVSAGGLGAGLVSLVPVLGNILGDESATLPVLAQNAAAKLPMLFPQGLPASWVQRLPTDRFDAVLVMVISLGVLTLIGATANFLHASLSLTLTTRTIASIRRDAYRTLIHLPLSTVVSGRGSDLTSRVLNDAGGLARGFQALTGKALAQATRGAAALVAAFLINWKLSLAMAFVAPVLAVIIRKLGKRIRKASRGAMKSQARLLEDANETIRGFRVVKIFTSESAELARFGRHNNELVNETLKLRTAQAISSPLLETISIFVLGGLALVAAKAIIDGNLPATEFLATMMALGVAGGALRPLTAVIQDIQAADAAAARLKELMRQPMEEPWTPEVRRRARLARHTRRIEFDRVSHVYEGAEEPALRDVSLAIEHGETVAFVGPNGCGKTTLLSLVPRLFEPTSGRVLIDGVDIAGVRLHSLRKQIGAVAQETILFRGTIASNIAYGTPDATREQVERAARLAHAHEFISRLPKGYDAPVGDAGLTLSGGQRQRLAIARALLRDPSILIMDEATSMIDSESEGQIAAAVAELAGTRTTLIVAHRLTTVLSARRIVVMDRGRVIDTGSHDELVQRCDFYRELTRLQLMPAGRG